MSTKTSYNRPTVIMAQLLAGVGGGILVGGLFGWIAGRTATQTSGFEDIARALGGLLIGYPLGVFAGIYLMGRQLRQSGSTLQMFVGAAGGIGLIMLLAEPLRLNRSTELLLALLAICPPLFAVLGYHWRFRRTSAPPPQDDKGDHSTT